MKETKEEVKDAEASWDEVGMEKSKFFSPEKDKPYTITIASAQLVRDERYLDKDGVPKLTLKLKLATINGAPTDQEWATGSWSIIREVKKCVMDKSLERSSFLMKMKEEAGRRAYIFEKVGEKQSPPSSFYDDVIEAYIP